MSLAEEGKRRIDAAAKRYVDPEAKRIPVSDRIALTTVTGWQQGQSDLTAVQHVAGTLVEIGIDYAAGCGGWRVVGGTWSTTNHKRHTPHPTPLITGRPLPSSGEPNGCALTLFPQKGGTPWQIKP